MSTVPVFGFVSTVEDVPQFRDLTALMRLLTTDEVGQGYSYTVPADAPGTAAQDGLYTYDSTGIQAIDGYDYTVNEQGTGTGYIDFTYDVFDGDGNHVETRKIIIELREYSATQIDEELSSSAPGYSDIPSDSADTLKGFRGDDTLDGGGGDDILIGGQDRDHLIGGDGDDYLFGSNGWDILEGGAGKDTIIGGGGNDTVVFDGNIDEFTVEHLDDGSYRITRKSDTTDTDTVSEVEFYQFNDGTLTVSELSLVLPDQSSDEDTEVSFTLPLDDYTDYFGDTLSLKATLEGGEPLPSWLSFDRATGTFSGTPPQDFNGSLSIEVQAIGDTADPVTHIFELTVTPVNDDPEVGTALADQSFDEDTAVSVTIPSDAFTDVDGDTLELTAWQRQEWGGQFPLIAYSPLPLWLSFDADTGIISGTPPQDFNGSLVIAIRASDGNGGDYAEQLFTLTIDPVNDNPEAGIALMDVIAVEGTDLSFDLPDDAFTDADGDALTYSATLEDGSALPSWLIFDPGTGTFSGTPPSGFTGTLSVKVTASDGKSGSTPASQVFNLTVEEAEYVTAGFDPVGGETEVVAGFNAEGVSIGALADGGYVVVWSELIGSGGRMGNYSQHAQRYDSDGTPIGSAFTVGTNVRSLGVRSEVVSLEDGGFLIQKTTVTFLGYVSSSVQRYDINGEAVGDRFYVPTSSSVIELDTGGLLMPDSNLHGHFAQFYDSNGNLLNSIQVSTTAGPNYYTGHATALAGGGYLTTWMVGQLGDLDIYARLLDSDGNPVGSDFLVNTTTEGNQSGGEVAALSDGGFVVTWWGNQDGSGADLFAQRFDSSGNPIGAEFQVNTTSEGFQDYQGLNELDDGGFVITWRAPDGQGVLSDYFAQRYDSNGSPIGGEFELTEAEARQYEPKTAVLSGGDLIEAFISETGVYTQRYAADGTLAGSDITGSDDANLIFGTEADDTIDAAGGDDTLTGGGGSDILSGGTGSDTFVFNFGDTGHDTITDFTAGAATDDVMEFDSALFATYDALLAAMTDDGTNTTITIDADTTITLENVTIADLHQDDFNFV